MAKLYGTIRSTTGGIGRDGSGDFSGSVTNIGSLREIQNTELRREIQQGISKFESRLGVRQRNVKLAKIDGAHGVHQTINGKSAGVYLKRETFGRLSPDKIIETKRNAYESGFLNRTNKPVQHTVVHELAHATWNNNLIGTKYQRAGSEVNSLYRTFLRENPRAWGSYSKTNVNEFFAEGITKGVLGKADKYTRALFRIVKNYNL